MKISKIQAESRDYFPTQSANITSFCRIKLKPDNILKSIGRVKYYDLKILESFGRGIYILHFRYKTTKKRGLGRKYSCA